MIAGERYYGDKVDIWSSGVILYAMVCGFLPFEDPDTAKLYRKILSGEFTIPKFVSSDGKDLIKSILNTEPDERFTASDIRDHKWFNIHQPVCKSQGLVVGKNQIPLNSQILGMT